MHYPFSDHTERLILTEAVLHFYALAYAGTYHFSEHAERLLVSEMIFNFYVLAYAGDYLKV